MNCGLHEHLNLLPVTSQVWWQIPPLRHTWLPQHPFWHSVWGKLAWPKYILKVSTYTLIIWGSKTNIILRNWKRNFLLVRSISCYSTAWGFRFPDKLTCPRYTGRLDYQPLSGKWALPTRDRQKSSLLRTRVDTERKRLKILKGLYPTEVLFTDLR